MLLHKKQFLLYVVLFCLPVMVLGQQNNNNWYFGKYAAMLFTGNPAKFTFVGFENVMGTRASACISDSTTGELLFYTDGVSVWNKSHQQMPNGIDLINSPAAKGTLIVPYPEHKGQYFIFSVNPQNTLSYSVVDMSLDNGLGNVTSKNTVLYANIAQSITAVKHQFTSGFWLITHSSNAVPDNAFFTFQITASGVTTMPVVSNIGEVGNTFADLVSNHKGNKLAITHYADENKAYAQVLDFDKLCGKITSAKKLYKAAMWDYAYGAAFSANDSKLYIAYGYTESQLVQYSDNDFSTYNVVATSDQNFNDILLGPDNILYISTHDNNIPSPVVDALMFPDAAANAVGYTQEALYLSPLVPFRTSNFEFPNLLTDTTTQKPTANYGVSILETNTCLGDSTKFSIFSPFSPDSVKWIFDDPNCSPQQNTSTLTNPSHLYAQSGTYWPSLSWYRCGLEVFMAKKISIINPDKISLGPDTTFCSGDTIMLNPNTTGATHLWNTGDTTPTLTITKGGKYWVKVKNGRCSGADTIVVSQHPPLWVEIGDEYSICDDSTELLKLDAGKGFEHYKWTPTGDTTQWIVVNKAGDYYVIVKDFRGCKAGDGATVKRQCDFTFYMPTAFTPNGDGKNDVFAPVSSDIADFRMEVFNRWGEKIFETSQAPQGWDGMYKNYPAPMGVYLWKLSFKGYHNKLFKNYNYNGAVTLVR
jgi:gliding motility-associated-like protein